MKVYIGAKVKPVNRKLVEEKALWLERTISDTLDRILDEYFAREKKRGDNAVELRNSPNLSLKSYKKNNC